jgi:hypothetical protein
MEHRAHSQQETTHAWTSLFHKKKLKNERKNEKSHCTDELLRWLYSLMTLSSQSSYL